MQLKKIKDDHYVVVTDEPIKKNDWYLTDDRKVLLCDKTLFDLIYAYDDYGRNPNSCKKITHSTQPLETISYIGAEMPMKCYNKIKPIDLFYIKSLVVEVDLVELSKNTTKGRLFANGFHEEVVAQIYYRKGYNQCIEDNKDKRFSEEDLRKVFNMARKHIELGINKVSRAYSYTEDEAISSLTQPKDTWEVEFINGQLKLK